MDQARISSYERSTTVQKDAAQTLKKKRVPNLALYVLTTT